ncbi:Uncharacterised protein [Bordetella pertussis]|nr:Uncharacterised protein [Bordetella pertussis]
MPGSWIRSNSTQFSSMRSGSAGSGARATNTTPWPLSTLASPCSRRESSARQCCGGTWPARARISGWSSRATSNSACSGVPWCASQAWHRCTPSSRIRPSRRPPPAASLCNALTAGLSRELRCFMARRTP